MFGIDLFDASLLPAMLVALTAGALSFLSPCVLPIVPPYLAYMGGITLEEMGENPARRAARRCWRRCSSCWACRRCSSSSASPRRSSGSSSCRTRSCWARIAGAVIIVFGLHFLGVINIPILNREARLDAGDRGGSALGAYILGLAFAFGWTPCIGPQLGAILSLAATEASVERGTTLLGSMRSGSASRSCWPRPSSTGPWR
jgi:cytochrome c-type biogenesis protein